MSEVTNLLEDARRATGLDDFGDDAFREGLERLVRSIRSEARLNDLGEVMMRQRILDLLGQRLQIEDWYRRHPEIADEPIVSPLFGLGLPRTGSTALSYLLAQDPATRSLRRWESSQPCPPPSTVEGPDPRVAKATSQLALQEELMPRVHTMVPESPTGPAECLDLMALDFKSHIFQAFAQVPSYSSWLLHEADASSTYAYERRVLQLLQWGEPTRPWRLKSPSHLLFIDQLSATFPDARFVMTHRDVADVIVSVADLYHEVIKRLTDDVDPHYIGALNVEHWSVGMRRTVAFRRSNGDRFFDVDSRAMQTKPLDTVTELYEWLGEPVSAEFRSGMQRWWAENGENRSPVVDRPEASYFGIDLNAVRTLFTA